MRFISVIISLLLVSTAIFGIYQIIILFSNINNPNKNGGTTQSPGSNIFDCKENVTQNPSCFGLVMTTRHEWVAQPPLNPIDKLDLPASIIILNDTKTEECFKRSKCNYLVRALQDYQTLANDDIVYNFLISSQGDIYEGRGWLLQSGEVLEFLRKDSYSIGLIGNFSQIPIPEMQIKAVQHFIAHAQSVGKLISTHSIYCSTEILISNVTYYDSISNTAGKYKKCLNIY